MATFIHIADERMACRIRRGGVRATQFAALRDAAAPHRGVFCVPVVANFQMTFQWLRELKRRGHRLACGVQFRINDMEEVFVGHYNQAPQGMTAAQSVAFFLQAEDARGLQVIVPRAIAARENQGDSVDPTSKWMALLPRCEGQTAAMAISGRSQRLQATSSNRTAEQGPLDAVIFRFASKIV
jgi:hypothetical protein